MNANEVEILLVEDNPNDVELTLRALRLHNLANRIHVARDGVEALDFLFQTGEYGNRNGMANPKVVFLDLKMPRVDGLEVLRKVRENDATRKIPIVIVTSSREEQDIVRGYEYGANSYVVKPVDFDKFISVMKELGMYWLVVNQPPQR